MTSIPGSQFDATAPGQPLVVVETVDGSGLPPTVPGAFNLEVWTGGAPYPSVPAAGYQGLAILGPGGTSITLVTGVYAVADLATGGQVDTITALGDNETISAGPGNNDVLSAYGVGDVITGGGADTINVYGNNATVNGVGDDWIFVNGSADNAVVNAGTGNDTIFVYSGSNGDTINAGTGNDLINILSTNDTVIGQGGNDTINVLGSNDSVFGGSGNDYILAVGDFDTIEAGSGNTQIVVLGNNNVMGAASGGNDTIYSFGNNNIIIGGAAATAQIASYGDSDYIALGSGTDAVTIGGNNDSVIAGSVVDPGGDTVTFLYGTNHLFIDGSNVYADTVIGFNQAVGDRILLTGGESVANAVATSTQVNGGLDTLITLSDTSTILLKGVTSINGSFFS